MRHPVLYTIIILVVVGAVAGSGGSNNNNTTVTSTTSSTSSTQSKNQEKIYNIGDTISNDTYEITISNVEQAQKVGSQYLNSEPAEGGTYVCVDFSYKNISNEPINSWNFPSLKIVDGNGVEYSSDISASSYYATEKDPNRKVLSDLNPGITVTDNDVFEISKESYNQGEWFIVIDKNIKIKIK